MEIDIIVDSVIQKITSGRQSEAIEDLETLFPQNDEIIKLKARIKGIEKEYRLGLISFEECSREMNKYTDGLIAFVLELKAENTINTTYNTEYGIWNDENSGLTYNTIKINQMCWMCDDYYEDLEDKVKDLKENSPNHCGYWWDEAKEIIPKGWHLPSFDEWVKLFDYFGGYTYNNLPFGLTNMLAGFLKLNRIGKDPQKAYNSLIEGGESGLNLYPSGTYWSSSRNPLKQFTHALNNNEWEVRTIVSLHPKQELIKIETQRMKWNARIRLVKS
ncbi:MAG: FISUMP domain-containing protein [Bacteroidota bacterium]